MASKSRKGEDPDYDSGKRKRGAKGGKDPNAPKRPLLVLLSFWKFSYACMHRMYLC